MFHTTLVAHVNKSYAPCVACRQPSPLLLCSSHSPDHTHLRVFLPVALLSEWSPPWGSTDRDICFSSSQPLESWPRATQQFWAALAGDITWTHRHSCVEKKQQHININKKSHLDSYSVILMVCPARWDFPRKLFSICHHLYIQWNNSFQSLAHLVL